MKKRLKKWRKFIEKIKGKNVQHLVKNTNLQAKELTKHKQDKKINNKINKITGTAKSKGKKNC